jgi:lipopolysaccharide biosynthesis glycosyltransferase
VPDHYWPVKDKRYRDYVEKHWPEKAGNIHDGQPYFNAGVLLVRLSARGKIDLSGPYPDDFQHDQDYLNMRVENSDLKPVFLDQRWNQRTEPNDTAFFAHFAGRRERMEAAFPRLCR